MRKRDTDPWLAGPYWPNHPREHAPRGHVKAESTNEKCPRCGTTLVAADGWVWCFNHAHPTEDSIVYTCNHERRE